MSTAAESSRRRGGARTRSRAYAVKDGEWLYAEMTRTYMEPPADHVKVRQHFKRGTTVAVRQRRFLYSDGSEEIIAYHVVSLTPKVWERLVIKPQEAAKFIKILRLDGEFVEISREHRQAIQENSALYSKKMALKR